MMKFTSMDAIDNKETRKVYAEMRRAGQITGMRFDTYLGRLKERNVAARRDEFNNRRFGTRLDLKEMYERE